MVCLQRKASWFVGIICLASHVVTGSAQTLVTSEEQALSAIAASRRERLDRAVPIELWAVLPERMPGDRLFLVLNNAFGADLSAAVDLVDVSGRAARLGAFKVPPSRHHKVDLESVLASDKFSSARSVRVTYPGDIEMFQAWLVREGTAAEEISLRSGTSSAARKLSIFWDASWIAKRPAKPSIHLLNSGERPLDLQGSYLGSPAQGFSISLAPREVRHIEVPRALSSGILTLEGPESIGSVLAFAAIESRGNRLSLPVSADDTAPKLNHFASVRIPIERSFLAVANLESDSRRATVSLFDPQTGGFLGSSDLEIKPYGIETFDVSAMLHASGGLQANFVSARIQVELGRVLLSGGSVSPAGRPIDVPVFAEEMAHQNGSYPVLDPSRFTTVSTLLNLGEEDSIIGGQVLWRDGTYTIGPLRIPAGGAKEINLQDRQFMEGPDRKGRALSSLLPDAYFQWTVLRGSHSILARTEARPKGSDDAVGFNCLGCCEEYSYGRVEPDGASFLPGQVRPLGANEYIASCGATLGPFQPYFTYLSAPSPFTWDGDNVSAWQPAFNSVYFEGEGERVRPPRCEARIINFGDGAPVQSLRVTIDEVSLPLDRIRIILSPIEANGLLTLSLRSPAFRDLIYNQSYSGGTYTFTFSPFPSYSEGQEFSQVFVEWKAAIGASAQTTASATYPYRFKVLGTYLHTIYNTPNESLCPGPKDFNLCYQDFQGTGGCGGINCTSSKSISAKSTWERQAFLNGGGVHSILGDMSREYVCVGNCGDHRYRDTSRQCPRCLDVPFLPNSVVAVSPSNSNLTCGDAVFVPGVGVRSVGDNGGGLSTRQLDHFVGAGDCNREAGTIGNLLTFKLCQPQGCR